MKDNKFKCCTCGTEINMDIDNPENAVKHICNMLCCFDSFKDYIERVIKNSGLKKRNGDNQKWVK